MRVNADAVCQRCCDLFIHRNVIFHKILRDHRCARPDLGADVLKPVLTLIIVRMMVDADDLISRNIDYVGIALLGIHQYHFVLIRQHFGQILHIQQFNVKNLTQTASPRYPRLQEAASDRMHLQSHPDPGNYGSVYRRAVC